MACASCGGGIKNSIQGAKATVRPTPPASSNAGVKIINSAPMPAFTPPTTPRKSV